MGWRSLISLLANRHLSSLNGLHAQNRNRASGVRTRETTERQDVPHITCLYMSYTATNPRYAEIQYYRRTNFRRHRSGGFGRSGSEKRSFQKFECHEQQRKLQDHDRVWQFCTPRCEELTVESASRFGAIRRVCQTLAYIQMQQKARRKTFKRRVDFAESVFAYVDG